MRNMHVHWFIYQYTIAQVGDLCWWDLHKCRCGEEKIKDGQGYSPYHWQPKDLIGKSL